MRDTKTRCVIILASAFGAWVQAQPAGSRLTVTAQSGLADTFQLTLGGTFGVGPAWQNRMTVAAANALRPGDVVSVYGWDTYDVRDGSHNWQVGLGYKAVVWKKGAQALTLGSGFQHWQFQSVKTGTCDYLIPGTLSWAGKAGKQAYLVTQDSWTLLSSPLPTGSLLHTQVWVRHPIMKREWLQAEFRHGPAHTYSWGFYGTNGHRVMRYQTMVELKFKQLTVEGGYRKQWGLQPGIVENNFWQFAMTKVFTVGGK